MTSPTPLVKLQLTESDCDIYLKLEGENPTGSIKDRFAAYVLEHGEAKGGLKQGMTIIDTSAGNTAVALAVEAQRKGYRSHFIVGEGDYHKTQERLKVHDIGENNCYLEALSFSEQDNPLAKAIARIEALCEQGEYYWTQQYYRDDSRNVYAGLSDEIFEQLAEQDKQPTILCASVGTGGTLIGVGGNLTRNNPNLTVIATFSAVSSSIQGVRPINISSSWGRYQDIYHVSEVHNEYAIAREQLKISKSMLEEHNISAGPSSQAALAALLSHLQREKEEVQNTAVAILPDGKQAA